ncbi:MAG: M13 family metallopeptidase [Alphaproteobacteria bacterium]
MISLSRRALTASTVALLAGCAGQTHTASTAPVAPPPPPPRPKPQIGDWGFDLSTRDTTVKPGDDFFRYANGTWLKNNPIPADRTRWGSFDILRKNAEDDVKAILEQVAQNGGPAGSGPQRLKDFYTSYINVDAINAAGLTPAQADLAAINAARNHTDIVRIMGRPDMPVSSPIAIFVGLDDRNPNRYVTQMSQAGLSLPDRDYYLRADAQFATIRQQFQAHVARMLTLAGQTGADAKARAVLALETRIAHAHWPIEQTRDREKTYNLKTRAQISALNQHYPWNDLFQSAEMGDVTEVVIAELDAIGPLTQIVMSTPVSTWKAYLTYHYLTSCADVLPANIDDANFDFYGKTLNGQPQQRERWRRGVDATGNALGELIGQIYVQQHFPASSKAQMQQLVENLRRSYGERIDRLSWMSAETKAKAREKLATFRPKIGYPDKWRDYAGLDIHADDAFGNAKRNQVYSWRYDLARLPRPTDKDEWFMTPQTVNAYYNPTFNEVVFPAAILQPPFFDPNADDAVNYGGIGAVIGHEMGHGFDDQGAKSDAQGVLRDWWNAADVTAFQHLTGKLADEYSAFEPLPGIHINGPFTLGENIGDNGGLQVAHYAYLMTLNGQPAPTLDGLSGDQRFFLSFGQIWRTNIRDARLRTQLLSDPHSPSEYRCNGTVSNMDEWYAAFNVQPGDKLYRAPADRVQIW